MKQTLSEKRQPVKPSYEELQERIRVLEKDQDELMNIKNELDEMFSTILDMICISDLKSECFVKVNQAFTESLGYTKEELLGRPLLDFIHPADLEQTRSVFKKKLQGGDKVFNFENRYRRKDGAYVWLNWTFRPNIEKGIAYSVARDITQIKQTESNLLESEKKYKNLFNSINDGISLNEIIYRNSIPVDYRILDTNRKYEEQTGIRKSDAKGALASQLYKTGEVPYLDIFANVARTGRPVTFEAYFPRLEKHFLASVFSPVRHQFATVFQDITERKQADRQLRESEHRYRSLFYNNHAVMLLIDSEQGKIIDANPAACAYYGYSLEEITRLKISDINTLPLDQTRSLMGFAKSMEQCHFFFRHRLASGQIRDVEVFSGPITVEGCELLYSIVHDVTERKRAEEALKQSNMNLEAANEDLESFIYSISHDLKGPLRSIAGFGSLLEKNYGDRIDLPGREYFTRIIRNAHRMGDLIDDLLRLSRIKQEAIDRKEVDLSRIASEIVAELRESRPAPEVSVEIDTGLTARADQRLLEVLLSNLLRNAWKFTANTTHPRIEFRAYREGGNIVYYVKDNGAGFDQKYEKNLFLPFHRLHSEKDFEGSGIGLAIVSRIIRRHGGKMWAEGEPGKGATFYFTLEEGENKRPES